MLDTEMRKNSFFSYLFTNNSRGRSPGPLIPKRQLPRPPVVFPQHLRSGTILPSLIYKLSTGEDGMIIAIVDGGWIGEGLKEGVVVERLGQTGLVARLTGVCVALAKGISHQIDINK